MTNELSHLQKTIKLGLDDLLDDLRQLKLHWTPDQFRDWLRSYLVPYPHARVVDLPSHNPQTFNFEIIIGMEVIGFGITQWHAKLPPPDYMSITRQIASL